MQRIKMSRCKQSFSCPVDSQQKSANNLTFETITEKGRLLFYKRCEFKRKGVKIVKYFLLWSFIFEKFELRLQAI